MADVIDSESPKDEDNDNPYIIPKCITNQVDTEVIDTNSLLEGGDSDPSKIVFNVRFKLYILIDYSIGSENDHI